MQHQGGRRMDLIDRKKLLESIDENIRMSVRPNDSDDRYVHRIMSIIYKQPKVDIKEMEEVK